MNDKEIIEQRKIVPVVSMISAGKSKFLNVLYNINYLECNSGLTTKFVNFLRYNPNIKQPCFYHLKIEKKKENYIFYKDLNYDVIEGEKNIIEANKNINKSLRSEPKIKYDDLFYMTEINEIPFIKDKEYLQTHDLCDIPGLNEYQNNKNNKIEEKEKENNNEFKEKLKKAAKEFGIVIKSIKEENKNEKYEKNKKKEEDLEDDIFKNINIENEHNYLTDIFKIIKNSIDGGIIILSIENYYKLENFEMIAKLHKFIQKKLQNF